jgi:FMN phosphatase YigB (HAD superfamily)
LKIILCIDLDDTLLAWTDDDFIKKSARAVCKSISSIPEEECFARMTNAIRHVMQREYGLQNLLEVFYADFCAGMSAQEQADVAQKVTNFYENDYHTLKQYTAPIPQGRELVEEAFRRGYEVVIATNPLFTRGAIQQRLQWAGVGEYLPRFRFVTTMENSYYAKPDPAYYSEILGKLGWREDTCVLMMGDSLAMDIIPASKAGLPAYWLSDKALPEGLNPLCAGGGYEGIFPWVEAVSAQHRAGMPGSGAVDLLAHLKTTPFIFDAICRSVSDDTGCKRPEEGEWSLVEIVCHLRDTDREVNLPRLLEAFGRENPFLTPIDTSNWASERNYLNEDGHEAAREFFEARKQIIDLLEKHKGAWCTTTARHAIFGPVSVADLIHFSITHDQMHIRQAQDTIAALSPFTI